MDHCVTGMILSELTQEMDLVSMVCFFLLQGMLVKHFIQMAGEIFLRHEGIKTPSFQNTHRHKKFLVQGLHQYHIQTFLSSQSPELVKQSEQSVVFLLMTLFFLCLNLRKRLRPVHAERGTTLKEKKEACQEPDEICI